MMPTTGQVGLLLIGALVGPLAVLATDGGVRVCVGADQVLRLAKSGQCPAGATAYELAEVGAAVGQPPGQQGENAGLAALQKQLSALTEAAQKAAARSDVLEQRVAALEAAPAPAAKNKQLGSRVVAPFDVVDAAGKTIFAVRADPRGIAILDDHSQMVVAASALAAGGFVKARNAGGALETVMGVNNGFAGFVLRQGAQARGTFAISEEGKPILNMANDNFVTVVALTQATTGGGYLELGNAAGASMVEAGVTPSGVGLVRAYPLGNPGAGLIGMPGTFILGRK